MKTLAQQFTSEAGEWTIYSNVPEPGATAGWVSVRARWSFDKRPVHGSVELFKLMAVGDVETICFQYLDPNHRWWVDVRCEPSDSTWLALSYFLRWHF